MCIVERLHVCGLKDEPLDEAVEVGVTRNGDLETISMVASLKNSRYLPWASKKFIRIFVHVWLFGGSCVLLRRTRWLFDLVMF